MNKTKETGNNSSPEVGGCHKRTARQSSEGDPVSYEEETAGKIGELQRLISDGLESGISTRSKADLIRAARDRAG